MSKDFNLKYFYIKNSICVFNRDFEETNDANETKNEENENDEDSETQTEDEEVESSEQGDEDDEIDITTEDEETCKSINEAFNGVEF